MPYTQTQLANLRPFTGVDDPRRINKPVGARMKQITKVRKLLERQAANAITAEEFTELEAIFEVHMAKAKDGDVQSFKAVMDYAGYKPTEHVEQENKDVEVFSSEENEEWFNANFKVITDTEDVVSEAQGIADGTNNI